MKKNTKSFIAKLLVLCMLVGMLPTVALAAGEATDGGANPYYRISLDATVSNGTVSVGGKTLEKGAYYDIAADTEAIVTFNPASGYTFTSATYTDVDSKETKTITSSSLTVKNQNITITAVTFTAQAPAPAPSTVAVTGVTLDLTELELAVGETGTLTATVAPSNATNQNVTWSSSNTAVATVANGTVTAVAEGTATITVTTADGGKTATCAVTVTAAPNTVVETVEVEATTDANGTAKAEVPEEDLTKAVEAVIAAAEEEDADPVVKIEVNVDDDAKALEVTLPTASLEALAEAEGSSLVITSDIAEIQLDNTALNALVDQADGSTVVLEVASVAADDENLTKGQQDLLGDLSDAENIIDLSLVNSAGEAIHDYDNGTITISVPYTLPENTNASSIRVYYMDDNGELTLVNATYKNGKVIFTTTHLSKYIISARRLLAEFTDILHDWYANAVDWAVRKEVTNGTSGNKFSPAREVTRAEIVTWLWRLAGSPEPTSTTNPFTDVDAGKFYTDAVLWAVEKGITEGRGNNKFEPGTVCSRSEIVTFLYRYLDKPEVDGSSTSFTDVDTTQWYGKAVIWAAENGVTTGVGNNQFNPAGNCHRADSITFLYRADRLD